MDYIVYLYYVLLIVLLFWGSKFYGKNNWNDGFLSLSQTKALQGFCAICIMLHHTGQRTCAPWLNPRYIVHGLDFFVPIGYFLVSVFFFCSGYGLYKSYKQKPNYLKGFLSRRLTPLIIASFIISTIYIVVGNLMGEYIGLPQTIFHLQGPTMYNPYGWYVIAIIIFYLGFYLAFRFCKKERTAIIVTLLVVLAYVLHCYFWMFGQWWYNSVLTFGIGLILAKFEQNIIGVVKKKYILFILVSTISMTGLYILANYLDQELYHIEGSLQYTLLYWLSLISQMLACSSFTILLFLIGMKVRIGNKVLAFMGSITLEYYLIHGIYVQMFSFRFMNDYMEPVFYIKNVALHVLVVVILSVPSAFFIHKLVHWLSDLMIEKSAYVKVIFKDFKKFIIVTLAVISGITIFLIGSNIYMTQTKKETVIAYEKKNITYADVDGKKMAAYITGEGEHTIVILGACSDPCPSMTLQPLADELADKNRVIILDFMGSGLSDDTDKVRSSDNLVYEIHTALNSLGEQGPFIIMPYEMSGLYAQMYTYTYPQEVEAVIGLDSCVPNQVDETIRIQRLKSGEYKRLLKKRAELQYLGQRVMSASGYGRLQWKAYESMLAFKHTREEYEVIQELFIKRFYNKTIMGQYANEYDNFNCMKDMKYAKDIPVYFILSKGSCDKEGYTYYGMDFKKMHEDILTNPDTQSITVLAGNGYFVYVKPDVLAKEAQKFIEGL